MLYNVLSQGKNIGSNLERTRLSLSIDPHAPIIQSDIKRFEEKRSKGGNKRVGRANSKRDKVTKDLIRGQLDRSWSHVENGDATMSDIRHVLNNREKVGDRFSAAQVRNALNEVLENG